MIDCSCLLRSCCLLACFLASLLPFSCVLEWCCWYVFFWTVVVVVGWSLNDGHVLLSRMKKMDSKRRNRKKKKKRRAGALRDWVESAKQDKSKGEQNKKARAHKEHGRDGRGSPRAWEMGIMYYYGRVGVVYFDMPCCDVWKNGDATFPMVMLWHFLDGLFPFLTPLWRMWHCQANIHTHTNANAIF